MTQNPLMPLPSVPLGTALSSPTRTSRFTPVDPLRLLRQYMWLLIIMGVVGIGLGIVAAILFKIYIPTFTSRSAMMIGPQLKFAFQPGKDPGGADEQTETLEIFIRNQVMRIKSEEILSHLLERSEVRRSDWYQSFNDTFDAFENIENNLKVAMARGTSIISLSFKSRFRDDVEVILDAVHKEYLNRYKLDITNQDVELRRTMVYEKDKAREERAGIRKELATYMAEHDLPHLEVRGTEVSIEYQSLSLRMANLRQLLANYQMMYTETLQSFQRQEPDRPEQQVSRDQLDPMLRQLTFSMQSLESSKSFLIGRMGPNHFSMQRIDSNKEVVQERINDRRAELVRTEERTRMSMIKKYVERVHRDMIGVQQQMNEVRERLRDLEGKLAEYWEIAESLQAVELRLVRADALLVDMGVKSSRPEAQRIKVIQAPTTAKLTFPNYPAVIIGVAFLSVAFTAGVVFLKEGLDERISGPSDLTLVPDATLLGVLPEVTEDPTGPAAIEGIVHKDPTGLIAEAFRRVRTELLSRMDQRGYKSLLIVGAQPECGTSTIANNLATSIVLNGRKVIIVDANFRRPSQCRLLDVSTTPGLVEVLNDQMGLEEAVTHHEQTQLDLLPAGDGLRTAPEIFENAVFRQLLAQLENDYDVVLIDGPPVIVAEDSKLITKQVDAVAMVVRAKAEKRGMIGRMLRQLEGQRADLLGVILNGVQSSAGGYFRKNYQAFYRYRQIRADGGQLSVDKASNSQENS